MSAAVIVFPGSNCDRDCKVAVERSTGEQVQMVWHAETELPKGLDLIVLPGGFSYGDYLRCGAMAAQAPIMQAVKKAADDGVAVLGICNGFQILTKLGILPDSSLIDNKKERFECVWAKLVKVAKNSPFLQGLPDEFELPSAHAEGRLVTRPGDAEKYLAAGNVALQYVDNRDGCECSIAGLQDSTGRAMGLMPHPERFLLPRHHYDKDWAGNEDWGWGYFLFKSAFDALK